MNVLLCSRLAGGGEEQKRCTGSETGTGHEILHES
jgi:hypothetical protein